VGGIRRGGEGGGGTGTTQGLVVDTQMNGVLGWGFYLRC
jgi:hypothetical protein